MTNFLLHMFNAWLQTICNAAVPDIPLHRYKRNRPITCDFPESRSVLRVAFLILSGIYRKCGRIDALLCIVSLHDRTTEMTAHSAV